ncbi:MAG TPA: MFS transporter [Polyangiaceae bacterium]|nr:MFS transporter [Polyangiaceae bacterium]
MDAATGQAGAATGQAGAATGQPAGTSPHVWVSSTYFAEGFPYSLVNSGAELLFKEMGASLGAVGLTSLLHLPWNLKFLWAPWVERWGSRRAFLIGAQLTCAVLLALAAMAARGVEALSLLAGLFLAMAVASATNDIAIDGYYLEALDDDAQARFVGYRATAYRVANLSVKAGLPLLAGVAGWRWGLGAMAAVLVLVALFHAVTLPRLPRPDTTEREGYMRTFRGLLTRPGALPILAFVVLFRTGESLLQKMKWPFFKDALGMTLPEYGMANGTVGVIVSLVATLWGGRLIARHGLGRCFWPFILGQNLLHLLYVGLAAFPTVGTFPVITAVIAVEEFGAGLGSAVLMVFLMRICDERHRATHFALLTAVMSLSFTFAGAVSGYLAQSLGYAGFFALTIVATLPMMLLAEGMRRRVAAPPA